MAALSDEVGGLLRIEEQLLIGKHGEKLLGKHGEKLLGKHGEKGISVVATTSDHGFQNSMLFHLEVLSSSAPKESLKELMLIIKCGKESELMSWMDNRFSDSWFDMLDHPRTVHRNEQIWSNGLIMSAGSGRKYEYVYSSGWGKDSATSLVEVVKLVASSSLKDGYKFVGRLVGEVRKYVDRSTLNMVLKELIALTASKDPKKQCVAATALGAFGPAAVTADALQVLAKLADLGTSPEVREVARRALWRVIEEVPADADLIKQLLTIVALSNRGPGAIALGWFSVERRHSDRQEVATELAREVIGASQWRLQLAAMQALQKLGYLSTYPRMFEALVMGLTSSEPELQLETLRAIRLLMPGWAARSASLLQSVCGLVASPDTTVKEAVAFALSSMGQEGATDGALGALVTLLACPFEAVQRAAVRAVWNMGKRAAEHEGVFQGLFALIASPDTGVKVLVAEALGSLGKYAATEEALKGLITLLGSSRGSVRQAALEAVGRLSNASVVEEMDLQGPPKASVMQNTAAYASPELLSRLVTLMAGSERVQILAIAALKTIWPETPNKTVTYELGRLLASPILEVQEAAARAVGALGERVAVPFVLEQLVEQLASSSPGVQLAAVEAVGQMGLACASFETLLKLLSLAESSDYYFVKQACRATALALRNAVRLSEGGTGKLTPSSKEARSAVAPDILISTTNTSTREEVTRALSGTPCAAVFLTGQSQWVLFRLSALWSPRSEHEGLHTAGPGMPGASALLELIAAESETTFADRMSAAVALSSTQQDDAAVYTLLEHIFAEGRRAAQDVRTIASAAAIVQMCKKHGFAGDFVLPENLMLVWGKAKPRDAPVEGGVHQKDQAAIQKGVAREGNSWEPRAGDVRLKDNEVNPEYLFHVDEMEDQKELLMEKVRHQSGPTRSFELGRIGAGGFPPDGRTEGEGGGVGERNAVGSRREEPEPSTIIRFLTADSMAEMFGVGLESAEVHFSSGSLDTAIIELPGSPAGFRASAVDWEEEAGFELFIAVRGPRFPVTEQAPGQPIEVRPRDTAKAKEPTDVPDPVGGESGPGSGGPPVQSLPGPGTILGRAISGFLNGFDQLTRRHSRNSQVGNSADPAQGTSGGTGGNAGGVGGGNQPDGGPGIVPVGAPTDGDPRLRLTVQFAEAVEVIGGALGSLSTQPTKSTPPVEQFARATCRVDFEFRKWAQEDAAVKGTLTVETNPGDFVANDHVYGYIQDRVDVSFGPSPRLHCIGTPEENLRQMEEVSRTESQNAEQAISRNLGLAAYFVTLGCARDNRETQGTDFAHKERHCDGFTVARASYPDRPYRVGSVGKLRFVRTRGPNEENFIATSRAGMDVPVFRGTESYTAVMQAEWELTGTGYAEFSVEVKQGLVREVKCSKLACLGGLASRLAVFAKHDRSQTAGVDCVKSVKIWREVRSLLVGTSDIQLRILDEGTFPEDARFRPLVEWPVSTPTVAPAPAPSGP